MTQQNQRVMSVIIPTGLLRAFFNLGLAWACVIIAVQWSAFWTLQFAASAVDYRLPEIIVWGDVPPVALALTAIITLAPASFMAYAGLMSTPLIIARSAFAMSLLMSVYDILTTVLGYDIFGRMVATTQTPEGAMTVNGILTWIGIFMTSVLASFADEAAIVFFTLSMIYFHESWKRWKGEDFEFLRAQVNTQTISGLERILGIDGRLSGEPE